MQINFILLQLDTYNLVFLESYLSTAIISSLRNLWQSGTRWVAKHIMLSQTGSINLGAVYRSYMDSRNTSKPYNNNNNNID